MRNLKKVLSLVLCLAMMLSVMVVGAGAAFTDQDAIDPIHAEAVDACVALNIITGYPEGDYQPNGEVTRAQMCKMICIALNGGKEPVLGESNAPTFTDTQGHWAEAYIESCVSQGIVAGMGDGKFNPEGKVTATQAAKMLLIALGYDADHQKYLGDSWAINVNTDASAKGLYVDLTDIDANAPLTREHAAQMIWNALNAYVVEYKTTLVADENGQLTSKVTVGDKLDSNFNKMSLLEDKFEADTEEAQMVAFTYNSNDGDWTYTIKDVTVTPAVTTRVKSSADYTDLLGQNVKVVYEKDYTVNVQDAYGIYAVDSQVVLTGVVGDLPDLSSATNSFKVDGTTYKTDAAVNATRVYEFTENVDVTITLSGTNLDDLSGASADAKDAQYFEAIDQDGNGKIDFVMIYPMAVAKVLSVTKDTVRLSEISDPMGKISTTVAVDVDDADIYDGIAKNDYVVFTNANNTAYDTDVIEKAELISGKIDKLNTTDREATIDSTIYTFDAAYGTIPTVGTTMTDAVVVNGYIFAATSTVSANPEDYVVAVSTEKDNFGWEVKLLFSDGTKSVVSLDEVYELDGSGNVKTTAETLSESTPAVEKGQLYSYEVNNSDEYTLTEVADEGAGAVDGKTSNSNAKAAYIDGDTILDDSVIFVQYDKVDSTYNSYKVISGETMKTMRADQFTVKYVDASENSSTGVGNVNFAYVRTDNDSISANDDFYGYVTAVKDSKNGDNKTVQEVTIYTPEEGSVTYLTTTGCDNVVKGSVIVYQLNSDGDMKSAKTNAVEVGSVSSSDGNLVKFSGGKTLYLADDVQIIDIDTKEVEGLAYEGCSIDTASPDGALNVYYVLDDDGDITFAANVADGVATPATAAVVVSGTTPTSQSVATDSAIKALSDGLHQTTDATAKDSGNALEDVTDISTIYIFKFTAPTADTYTLNITYDGGDKVAYTETSTSTMATGAHYFYVDVKAGDNGGGWVAGSGDFAHTNFATGSYSYSVINSSGVPVLTGTFTI